MADNKSPVASIDSFVEEIRGEWRRMWKERIDDHVRAEGIARRNYDKLFVERGTVVLATRNFKFLTLNGILEQHKIVNANCLVSVSPYTGGWRRFGRAHAYKRSNDAPKKTEADNRRQLKKGGKGWLHT